MSKNSRLNLAREIVIFGRLLLRFLEALYDFVSKVVNYASIFQKLRIFLLKKWKTHLLPN